mmetsp:Transcript_101380/g.160306  ORF Transcript_101380/g.160306 Transcript_101380/m.160306 type:complete len:235 (-) Transcript_101380:61-765(-)
MTAAEAKFFQGHNKHRTVIYDQFMGGKEEFRGNLNFSALRQGRDPQYLGVNGKNYYAKPWGNDSSNVQAVLNGPSYWKRVYYRPNMHKKFAEDDARAEAAREAARQAEARVLGETQADTSKMKKSASEGAMTKLADEPVDGYEHIKATMRPYVEKGGKPRIKAPQTGERLHFFNTMSNKYHMKAGGKNLSWNVDSKGHRSSKNEINWILSNYFRTDTQAVLSGCGSEPIFAKTK